MIFVYIDKAGAVAKAIPPNIKAINIGTFAIQKTIEKTKETNKKVKIDCTKVIPMICLPELLIFLKDISLPIITPAKHSNIFTNTSYHKELVISSVTIPTRYGPKTIPVISHPRMAGSLIFEISFPTIIAMQMIPKTRKISTIIIKFSPILRLSFLVRDLKKTIFQNYHQ